MVRIRVSHTTQLSRCEQVQGSNLSVVHVEHVLSGSFDIRRSWKQLRTIASQDPLDTVHITTTTH